jgi:hypothetical protein
MPAMNYFDSDRTNTTFLTIRALYAHRDVVSVVGATKKKEYIYDNMKI